MTREEREEALDVLTDMANALYLIPTTRQGKVFKLVLQELQKPEPCDDVISRQAVAEVLLKYAHSAEGKAFAEFLISQINALPPVTPQYTDAEIQKMQDLESAEIQKAYEIGKAEGSEVLDKIRAELHSTAEMHQDGGYYVRDEWIDEIFDKYKAESEVQDADCD